MDFILVCLMLTLDSCLPKRIMLLDVVTFSPKLMAVSKLHNKATKGNKKI